MEQEPISVILDTDIGDDIDDTWALAMMLKLPVLDVKLVVSDTDDTRYRAELLAKLLEVAGRTDVPVGVGLHQKDVKGAQQAWLGDYKLEQYPGKLYTDGVGAIVETIMGTDEPTLICIGPMPNIAAALEREPRIAAKTHFVGMHGSIRKHLDNTEGQIAEYNVAEDIPAAHKVFTADWKSITITPLDTCGSVRLEGERYSQLTKTEDKLTQAVLDNYRVWSQTYKTYDPETSSSILFDTVAMHLAYSTKFLKMEPMGIRIDNEGFMRTDGETKQMNVAIDWTDYQSYLDYLTEILLPG